MGVGIIPYCGTAPIAAELWSRWNLDPWLIAALTLGVVGFARLPQDASGRRASAFAFLLLGVAFVSPLCALASALFSARVAHHLLLIAGVAPLLAFASRHLAERIAAPLLSLTAITVLHALAMWLWHTPTPYQAALASVGVYWLMELSLLGSAYLWWLRVLAPRTAPGAAVLSLLATMAQMGLLGAVLVFAPRPLFAAHFGTTATYGMTAVDDQQLAGLVMWVPAMLPYFAVTLTMCAHMLRTHATSTAR